MLLRSLSLLLIGVCAAPLLAATPQDAASCTTIEEDAVRLACYDRALRAPEMSETAPGGDVFPHEGQRASAGTPTPEISLLDRRWELDPDSKRGAFHIRAYRPVYLLPVFWTSDTNREPYSPAPGHQVSAPEDIDHLEVKYQLSLKTKVWENIFGDNGDLWMGYTQVSHWQLYAQDQSRPFRETTYEPDATLMFRTDYNVLGWNGRLFGIGLDHQSNGRSNPLSRS